MYHGSEVTSQLFVEVALSFWILGTAILMKNASINMKDKIETTNFLKPDPSIISNVTAKEESDINMIKKLLNMIDLLCTSKSWESLARALNTLPASE